MDTEIRPRPSNLHKPRVRIVERRETVYEIRQPDYDVVRDTVGQVKAVPSGRFLKSMTCAELSDALVCAPRGAATRATYALEMAANGYQPILDAS
jgi:hypothetical protein